VAEQQKHLSVKQASNDFVGASPTACTKTLFFDFCTLYFVSLLDVDTNYKAQSTELKAQSKVQSTKFKHFVLRKGSLTGKAVVPKTTARLSLAGSTPVPSAKVIADCQLPIADWSTCEAVFASNERPVIRPKSQVFTPIDNWQLAIVNVPGPVAQRN
jgi:hypothetical protein